MTFKHYNPPTLPPSFSTLKRAQALYNRWRMQEQALSHSGIPQPAWCHLVDEDRKRWCDLVLVVLGQYPASSSTPHNIEPPALEYP